MSNENNKDRSVSKKDELLWRLTVQPIINKCLENMWNFDLARHVMSYREALFFNISGLPFKTEILKKEKELNELKEKKIEEEKQKYIERDEEREYYGTIKLHNFNVRIHRWYWTTFFEFLQDLIARHDAWVKAKGYVEEGHEMSSEKKETNESDYNDDIE